jgi:hypothetical protein
MGIWIAPVYSCLVLLLGSGCTGEPPADEPASAVAQDVQQSGRSDGSVTAARSEDLVDGAAIQLVAATACHAATTCPGYGSCASWVAPYSCGSPACTATPCIHCTNSKDPDTCDDGAIRHSFTEAYRVCFNANRESCTEFAEMTSSTCVTNGSCPIP